MVGSDVCPEGGRGLSRGGVGEVRRGVARVREDGGARGGDDEGKWGGIPDGDGTVVVVWTLFFFFFSGVRGAEWQKVCGPEGFVRISNTPAVISGIEKYSSLRTVCTTRQGRLMQLINVYRNPTSNFRSCRWVCRS